MWKHFNERGKKQAYNSLNIRGDNLLSQKDIAEVFNYFSQGICKR